MKITVHQVQQKLVAEVNSDSLLIPSVQDSIDLLGHIYFQGFDGMILHENSICAEFFDLKSGMAGEILQKFSTYKMRLIIVGDLSRYTQQSKSLGEFIFESNKGRQINFVNTLENGLALISKN